MRTVRVRREGGREGGREGCVGRPLFPCRIYNAKVITATLTCLSNGGKKDQLAQVEVNEDGTCEEGGREGGREGCVVCGGGCIVDIFCE